MTIAEDSPTDDTKMTSADVAAEAASPALADHANKPGKTDAPASASANGKVTAQEPEPPVEVASGSRPEAEGDDSENHEDDDAAESKARANSIRLSEFESRFTWIGEGLLDGEGLAAVEHLSNLPTVAGPARPPPSPATSKPTSTSTSTSSSSTPSPSPNKLLNFLAKEENYHADAPPPKVVQVTTPNAMLTPTSTSSSTEMKEKNEEQHRKNKLLDFLATDIGERYLDDVYQDEDREIEEDDETEERSSMAEANLRAGAVSTSKQNNRLLAFLAQESGERFHDVEKLAAATSSANGVQYGVAASASTASGAPPAAASASASASASSSSASSGSSRKRNKLLDFVSKTVSDRPKFVIFNPEDVTSSSGSEDEREPISSKELRLKRQAADLPKRARAVRAGIDDQAGVFRQPVKDLYGRTDLLDFIPNDGSAQSFQHKPRVSQDDSVLPSSTATAMATPKAKGKDKPVTAPSSAPKPVKRSDSRLTSFLRKFSSHPADRSPNASPQPITARMSSPPLSRPPPAAPKPVPVPVPAAGTASAAPHRPFYMRSATTPASAPSAKASAPKPARAAGSMRVSKEPDCGVIIESDRSSSGSSASTMTDIPSDASKVAGTPSRTPSAPATTNNTSASSATAPSPSPSPLMTLDSAAKRMVMIATMRQLIEDCEKHELTDLSMVRVSTLLGSISQIVQEDMRKERPSAQSGLLRRLSTSPAVKERSASWVRSDKEQEEYEKGHVTTMDDVAAKVKASEKEKQDAVASSSNNNSINSSNSSSPALAAPKLPLHPIDGVEVAEGVMSSLTAFEIAQNMNDILVAHRQLLRDCGLDDSPLRAPLRVYHQIKAAVYGQLSFRQKQLFRLLDEKLSIDTYRQKPCMGKRVCVVGAGPVGLRAAVEIALLGGQVIVLDKRKHFNRENILHLWPWVVQDLTSLGAKVFYPHFCHSSAYFHVGTRQLQCILLKVALLLGVTVYRGTTFEGLASPESIVSERKPYYTVVTKPQIPWMEFTAVIGASGNKDTLCAHAKIKRFVFSRKEAIGLVCYFPNTGSNEEKKVREFSWTLQFKQQMFAKLREIGIDLENVVYYRGEYHYLVMTPKRQNLLDQGVLNINYPVVSDLVSVDNLDASALNEYVTRVINFFEIPQKSEFARVRLFDFSARTRAAQAANILQSRGKKLYVGVVGDALMEPFWPEGLGTCRGFLSAMDASWMVSQVGSESDEQILADRELSYRVMQHISGFQRDDLQKNVRKYTTDPASRYTVRFPAPLSY